MFNIWYFLIKKDKHTHYDIYTTNMIFFFFFFVNVKYVKASGHLLNIFRSFSDIIVEDLAT